MHFKQKNRTVIAVKHTPHKYYVEPESADTFKFLEAGADEACLVAKNEMLQMRQITDQTDAISILKIQYAHCDFLLLEGLHQNDIPLIEVFDSGKNNTLKFPIKTLCAVVSDKPINTTVPNFNRKDINEISKFMEEYNG
jgi:molybdopterin-guanine dinucleotide biosynthesis protein MobB